MSEMFSHKNNSKKNEVKVLHVFAPSLTSRFSGDSIWWKNIFEHWSAPEVVHYVLDSEKKRIGDAKETFQFEYSETQKRTSRWGRAIWIIDLFRILIEHKGKYDILHVHVLWWGGLLIGPWANWNGIPALYQSVLFDSDTPGGLIKEKFGRVKASCLKSYKSILTISEHLADDYLKFGFTKEQVFTLINCVDVDLFSPSKSAGEKSALRKKLSLPQDSTILVFVGSVIARKGVDVLIQAFVDASSIRSDLHLLIVGPRNKNENPSLDEGFVNDLYSLINKNNLSERVIFTGLIQDRERLAEIYRASDIFVFPSNNEGLGNVVLEAMGSELPVVVSQLPVLEKVVTPGENGLIIPIGDADALKDAILTLVAEPSLARKIGQNAHQYIRTHHGFLAWQTQLTDFYKGLLS